VKKFQFRLETVLKLRQREEEKCRQELGLLILKRNEIEKKIEKLNNEIDQIYQEQRDQLTMGILGRHVSYYPVHVDGHKSKIDSLKKMLFEQDEIINDKKNELSDKKSKLQIMEKLKEKDKFQWKKEYNKFVDNNFEEMTQNWIQSQIGRKDNS
jgi:flagellar protein FliJ